MDEVARAFRSAWTLMVKYIGGPQGDLDVYWQNVINDATRLAGGPDPDKLTKTLILAVLDYLDEADRRARGKMT